MYLHELVLDHCDLELDEYPAWRIRGLDEPCELLKDISMLCIVATLKMNELEPNDTNIVFVRFPIED